MARSDGKKSTTKGPSAGPNKMMSKSGVYKQPKNSNNDCSGGVKPKVGKGSYK